MNAVSTVGIDLAKNVFSVHAVVARRTLSRAKLGEFIAQLPACRSGPAQTEITDGRAIAWQLHFASGDTR